MNKGFKMIAPSSRANFTQWPMVCISFRNQWDIARRLRPGLSQRVILYDEQISPTKQVKPVEVQRLLFEGRQLEDGSSPARIIKASEFASVLLSFKMRDYYLEHYMFVSITRPRGTGSDSL